MSKSGQPATKADNGGQRVPKSGAEGTGTDKKTPTKSKQAKQASRPKPGP